jgi:signal transduction histidine kinase
MPQRIVRKLRTRVRAWTGHPEDHSRELERQVTRRTRELAALNAIAAVVSRSLDLKQILTDALDKTLEVTGLDAGGIYLLRDAKGTDPLGVLTLAAHSGLSPDVVAAADDVAVGEGFSGRVVKSCEPMVVDDMTIDPRQTRDLVRERGYRSLAVVPLVSRARVLGTLFVTSRTAGLFSAKDIDLLESIGGQIGVAIQNAQFFASEQRRAEQFRAIAELGRRITLILDVDEVLRQVTRLVQQTFAYYHVAVGLVEGDEVVYEIGAGELWDEDGFRMLPARLRIGEEGISGWVAATGEPLLVPDVSKDPRYVWMQGSRTRSELTAPILVKGKVIGVLDAQSDRLNDFDDMDLTVLESLAHQAGAAIEIARLYEQAQQAAITEERSRLARELHDAVTQTLFSASLLSEALPAAWEADEEEGRQLLSELRQLNRGALAEMRTLLLELRPSALVEANLADLLNQLAEAATGREGIPVHVTVDHACRLPTDIHVALYRIAQEAVNNVVKHARASEVHLGLLCRELDGEPGSAAGKEFELFIQDNGRGFDPTVVHPGCLGLSIMDERAAAIGAALSVESQPGHGTRVTIIWRSLP